MPTLEGPQITGVPTDPHGFIPVTAYGEVRGLDGVYAAGDVTAHPIKHGGVAEPFSQTAVGFVGIVEPRFSTELGFRLLGRVVTRDAEIGDVVEAGEVLATLDATVLSLSVRALEAELSNAEAQLTNASATEERQRALVERNAGTRAEFEQAQEARETASAAATRARTDLDKAREQLSYTRLVSDSDGIVTATGAEVGQTVTVGQTVVTVARADVREAVVDIPDEIALEIEPGMIFDATLQIDETAAASGKVREIAPEADSATRTRRVRITLDAPPASFRLGTTIAAVPRRSADATITLPRSALLEADGRSFVWVVDEAASTVSRMPVAVAGETGDTIRIESGIAAGTRVVTAGVNTLKDGQAVKLGEGIAP
ncbi:MAG: efflux RND transporter periplasmic adaptor subunit [Rhizobiaceae bacterium]|nr:efflux RND transporter periplasmic adaptor subunit [Rhizobiaceae bacterium]